MGPLAEKVSHPRMLTITSLAMSGKEEKASRFYSPGGFLFEREVNEAELFRRFLRYGVLL